MAVTTVPSSSPLPDTEVPVDGLRRARYLDGVPLLLSEAAASGGTGTMTQSGESVAIEMDGTGVSTPAAPAAWASWPVPDASGVAIAGALSAFRAEAEFSSLPPGNTDMRVAVVLMDDPDPTAASMWWLACHADNGATAADPDLGVEVHDIAESLVANANGDGIRLQPYQYTLTGVSRVYAEAFDGGVFQSVVTATANDTYAAPLYVGLLAYNPTGGGGAADTCTLAAKALGTPVMMF